MIWTVSLLYPDYLNEDGAETYLAVVGGATPQKAAEQARKRAATANDVQDPNDFRVLHIFLGDAGTDYGPGQIQ